MPETNPVDPVPVQLAWIRGQVAGLTQNLEVQGKELDHQGQELTKVVRSVQRADEWREHYSEKIDKIHASLVGNGGRGLLTRVAVLEAVKVPEAELVEERIANVGGVSELKVAHVKESSIDWKWLALFAVNALVVIILAATNLK